MNILITGGASGLGEALTRALAAEAGNRIYFTFNKSAQKAADLEKSLPNAQGIKCDFTNEEELNELLAKMNDWDLDALINNALTSLRVNHFHKLPADDFKSGFLHDTLPTVILMQKAVSLFRKKKAGRLITILSTFIIGRPPAGHAEYVAGKAYLLSITRSIAVENAAFNITANCLSPSFMQTGLTDSTDERLIESMIAGHPLKRLLEPGEVAEVVKFLLSATPHLNGVNIPINAAAGLV
jgi:3-oxoacyl-[acyl-carrier protein] reductase